MLEWIGERYIPDANPEEVGAEIHYDFFGFSTRFNLLPSIMISAIFSYQGIFLSVFPD